MINGFRASRRRHLPVGSQEFLNGVQQASGFVPDLHRV